MASLIKKLAGSSSEFKFQELPEDDPKIRQPNIEKAKKFLDWEPQVKLDKGLKITIEYFKAKLGVENDQTT